MAKDEPQLELFILALISVEGMDLSELMKGENCLPENMKGLNNKALFWNEK